MVKVIGVRFRTAGKIYFFDPGKFQIEKGDNVIVETARGIEFGTVVGGVREIEEEKVIQPLKPVLRIATERDKEQEAANKVKEKEAFQICLEKIRKHGLDMKLIDAEYTFDNNKVLFYFTADGRIDFRELVKDLASVFKTRIELRQIGVRDETKTVGGIGICGRVLCCHSYLSDFIPVSIKMAKEQNLSLNPAKISGVCGRLMCCLKHEEETYEELNRKLPKVGDFVTTEDGMKGEVTSVNVLRQLVKVVVETDDEKQIKEYKVEQIRSRRRHGRKDKAEAGVEEQAAEKLSADGLSKEELKELELLEKEEDEEVAEREEKQPRPGRGNNKGEKNARTEKGERPRPNREKDSESPERKKNNRNGNGRHPKRNLPGENAGKDSQQAAPERGSQQNVPEKGNQAGASERGSQQNAPERGSQQAASERGNQAEAAGKNERRDRGRRNGRPYRQGRKPAAETGRNPEGQ